MSEITNEYIINAVKAHFGSQILSTDEPYGLVTFTVNPASLKDIIQWLKNHPEIKVNFLTDICGAHFPDLKNQELNVIYHVQSMVNNIRIRLKCFLPIENPTIASVTDLFAGANWMERETFDFYGIQFTGHPNLKRILNVDEMDYFPLRKEYPLEDGTRTDKEDQYFGR